MIEVLSCEVIDTLKCDVVLYHIHMRTVSDTYRVKCVV